jgi:ligand-binding sensor domain-containing protein
VWVGTRHGLVYYEYGQWTEINCPRFPELSITVTKLAIDHQDQLWVATNKGLYKRNGESLCYYPVDSTVGNPNLIDLAVESEGDVWALSFERLYQITPESIIYHSSYQTVLPKRMITCEFDKAGALWIGSRYNGLFKFDYRKGITLNYNKNNSSLPTNSIYDIAFDSDNHLWLATNFGVAEFSDSLLNHYESSFEGIPHNLILTVEIDSRQRLWIGSASGLSVYDGTSWTVYNSFNSTFLSDWIFSISPDDNGAWVGTDYGLIRVR